MSEKDDHLPSEIAVPSKDPEQKDADKPKANGHDKGKAKEDSNDEPEIASLRLTKWFPPADPDRARRICSLKRS